MTGLSPENSFSVFPSNFVPTEHKVKKKQKTKNLSDVKSTLDSVEVLNLSKVFIWYDNLIFF